MPAIFQQTSHITIPTTVNDGGTILTINTQLYTTMAKHGLSEDEVGDLKEAFGMFDIDGDGKFFRGRGDILVRI